MRPLYKEANDHLTWQGGHAGLWYDKFCNEWKSDWSELGDNGKKNWINTVTDKPCGGAEQSRQAVDRMVRLLEHHNQTPLFYKLETDFVTGLGREHPVDNGFTWHHTLGTPYLPGSSIKGMVRAWAKNWKDEASDDIPRIFGPSAAGIRENRDVQANVGSVIFFDALPIKPVKLKADIMTPHYSPYYQDETGQTPPADWHDPIPIPFLVVEQGQTFVFGILPRRKDERNRADCEQVKKWLNDALAWIGAGAKTAVGYGRFVPDAAERERFNKRLETQILEEEKARAEAKLKAELASMSPLLREMHEDGYGTGDFIGRPMQKWLERMSQAEGEEKREIAQHLKSWYLKHRTDQWSKPNKKNAPKIALIKEVLRES